MKRWVCIVVVGWMVLLGVVARAGGVDGKFVAGDAKWVVHVDVDELAKTKVWGLLQVNIDAMTENKQFTVGIAAPAGKPGASKKMQIVAEALGMRLPEDLHGITLIGRSFDETGAVLVVKGKFDKDRLIGMAKINPGYTSEMHKGVEVSSFTMGDEEVVAGAFVAEDVLILGRSTEDVEAAMDVKGKKGGLVAGGEAMRGAGVVVYVAAEGLAELQEKEELSPILAPVTKVQASIGESGEDVVLKAVLTVKTEEAARQVRGALEGVRAMVSLATLEDGADPMLKLVGELSRRAVSTAKGTTVTIDWPVAIGRLQELAEEQMQPKRKATSRKAATQKVDGLEAK